MIVVVVHVQSIIRGTLMMIGAVIHRFGLSFGWPLDHLNKSEWVPVRSSLNDSLSEV